jgi:hypothetical protein
LISLLIRELAGKRGAFYTRIETIDRRMAMKLPISVQAWERNAEENHSEVGGNGSKLPPC